MAHHLKRWPSIGPPVHLPQHDKRSPNASLMLAHRLQSWLSRKTALAEGRYCQESP